jgi:hypothetical protein
MSGALFEATLDLSEGLRLKPLQPRPRSCGLGVDVWPVVVRKCSSSTSWRRKVEIESGMGPVMLKQLVSPACLSLNVLWERGVSVAKLPRSGRVSPRRCSSIASRASAIARVSRETYGPKPPRPPKFPEFGTRLRLAPPLKVLPRAARPSQADRSCFQVNALLSGPSTQSPLRRLHRVHHQHRDGQQTHAPGHRSIGGCHLSHIERIEIADQ